MKVLLYLLHKSNFAYTKCHFLNAILPGTCNCDTLLNASQYFNMNVISIEPFSLYATV